MAEADIESPHNRSQRRTLQMDFVSNLLICHIDLRRCRSFGKMLNEDGPGNSDAQDSVPVQRSVAWPASTVFSSAPRKSPMTMTSRVTIGMMDCLNLTTVPVI